MINIIGIGGTDGSGKDTLGHILAVNYGYLFLTVTDLLRNEAKKRSLPLKRETYRQISAQWRRSLGMAVLIDRALKEYESNPEKNQFKGLAVASLRHPAEADRIRELGGKVVWVDAEPKIRYQRINARNRGAEDRVSYKEFLLEEKAQMNQSGDEATLSLAEVKEKADISIENNQNDIEVFKELSEKALGL